MHFALLDPRPTSLVFLIASCASSAAPRDPASPTSEDQPPTAEEIAAELANPLAPITTLSTQFRGEFGLGPSDDTNWAATLSSEANYNWEAPSEDAWTIPLAAGASRVVGIGREYVNLGLSGVVHVEHPDFVPDWELRLGLTYVLR